MLRNRVGITFSSLLFFKGRGREEKE